MTLPPPLAAADVRAAVPRVQPYARPVTFIAADPGAFESSTVYLADEATQFTGSFKARGALNFTGYHAEHGTVPPAGVTVAAHGRAAAAIACAWAARRIGAAVTVYAAPDCTPAAIERLRRLGAALRTASGGRRADDDAAKQAAASGALHYHAYDNQLAAAGAGTIALEIMDRIGDDIDTVVVPVGTGTLLAGVCAALEHSGVKVVPAEPAERPALTAALAAAQPVELPARATTAQDCLGAPRVSALALAVAAAYGAGPVLVPAEAIDEARAALWSSRRLPADRAAATALAALRCGAYKPDRFERVAILVTGADIDPAPLTRLSREHCDDSAGEGVH